MARHNRNSSFGGQGNPVPASHGNRFATDGRRESSMRNSSVFDESFYEESTSLYRDTFSSPARAQGDIRRNESIAESAEGKAFNSERVVNPLKLAGVARFQQYFDRDSPFNHQADPEKPATESQRWRFLMNANENKLKTIRDGKLRKQVIEMTKRTLNSLMVGEEKRTKGDSDTWSHNRKIGSRKCEVGKWVRGPVAERMFDKSGDVADPSYISTPSGPVSQKDRPQLVLLRWRDACLTLVNTTRGDRGITEAMAMTTPELLGQYLRCVDVDTEYQQHDGEISAVRVLNSKLSQNSLLEMKFNVLKFDDYIESIDGDILPESAITIYWFVMDKMSEATAAFATSLGCEVIRGSSTAVRVKGQNSQNGTAPQTTEQGTTSATNPSDSGAGKEIDEARATFNAPACESTSEATTQANAQSGDCPRYADMSHPHKSRV